MEFKYFQGPIEEMADLSSGVRECIFCETRGKCFRLASALCESLSDEQKESASGCFACLQQGRFEFWHDTEIGVLDESGLTHVYNHNKIPPPDFSEKALIELRRTPQIVTWQQELWLTHCSDFMIYVGTWEPKDFNRNAPDGDGRSLFLQMTDPDINHLWDESFSKKGKSLLSWHATYYVFRCAHCGKLRGNWDCD
jgi:uncharacterized protein CbrC (UPF0167 family)